MQYETERESKIKVKESKRKHKNTYNKICNEKETIFVKVENEMIYYTTITEKAINWPCNEISYSQCVVLLKVYDYCVNNIIRTIDD